MPEEMRWADLTAEEGIEQLTLDLIPRNECKRTSFKTVKRSC